MVDTQPRTLAEFGELTAAEQQVLAELDTGQTTKLADGKLRGALPGADAGEGRLLRARFVRWVALGCEGSQHRLHEKGLQVAGALIVSDGPKGVKTRGLDLEGCRLEHDLCLIACRFEGVPLLRSAEMRSLILGGSALPGLGADRLVAAGNVVLRDATITGEARLLGARIGGDLGCAGATLSNKGGIALNADGIRTEGIISLHGATVTGAVRLPGARIGGSLDCDGATLSNEGGNALSAAGVRTDGTVFLRGATVTGAVRLLGAQIGGNLDCIGATLSNKGGFALIADGAQIEGTFFLRADVRGQHTRIEGALDLAAAEIGRINDHPRAWPGAGSLVLDRCTYGSFTKHGVSAEERKRWLALQEPSQFGHEFWPQPYEQCAKVLREMGHVEDAREILIEKERLQRAALRHRARARGTWRGRAYSAWRRVWDGLLGKAVGYGQKPLRALHWLALLWLIGLAGFYVAWELDQFKPNNLRVLGSAEWLGCAESGDLVQGGESQLACYFRQPVAQDYPEFNAGIYALDVLAPVVGLEQQKYWTPDEDRWGGWVAWSLLYGEIIMGWLLSLLAVAGLSGLIRSD